MLSGLCCGIAAVMMVVLTTTGSAAPTATSTSSTPSPPSIIGGTALTGGRGTIVGSLLGVLVFTTITNLFIVNNLPTDVQQIVKGVIIVAAVLIQQFRAAPSSGPGPQLAHAAPVAPALAPLPPSHRIDARCVNTPDSERTAHHPQTTRRS